MEAEIFLDLPTEAIARIVRQAGPKVCGFPINGTRRWFMVEYTPPSDGDWAQDYMDTISEHHVALYRMLFDHGLNTVLAPVFGPDLMERGSEYAEMAAHGLALLAKHPAFLNLYQECDARVGFYGDYRQFFANTPFAYLTKLFDEITETTKTHQRVQLLFGICASDPVETIAGLSVRYFTAHGRAPDKRALIRQYYGLDVPALSFFIGFDKFCMFDMPLITTGSEDLYFTVSPSLYLTRQQLREILYDHLYARRVEETDYRDIAPDDLEAMRAFYRANRGKTLGVGDAQAHGGFWYPLPQVELPIDFVEPTTQG